MSGRLNVPALHGELKKRDMPARLAHRKRRIVKKRVARFLREQKLAEKWQAGRDNWATIAVREADQLARMVELTAAISDLRSAVTSFKLQLPVTLGTQNGEAQ